MFLLIVTVLQRPQSLPSRQSEPVLVLVCLSLNSKYSLPSTVSFNFTSPQHMSLCSLQPLSPKCIVLFNQSVLNNASGFRIPRRPFSSLALKLSRRLAYFLFLFSLTLSVWTGGLFLFSQIRGHSWYWQSSYSFLDVVQNLPIDFGAKKAHSLSHLWFWPKW